VCVVSLRAVDEFSLGDIMSASDCVLSYEKLLSAGEIGFYKDGGFEKLPLPPMLMLDRVISISSEGGDFGKGMIVAEQDLTPDKWFFQCHFRDFPVMPGCLAMDALWQLLGVFLSCNKVRGKMMAMGANKVSFRGMITPDISMMSYVIHVRRLFSSGGNVIAIADGVGKSGDQELLSIEKLRVVAVGQDSESISS